MKCIHQSKPYTAVVIGFTFLENLEHLLGVQEDIGINHKAAQFQQSNTFPQKEKKHLCEITFLLYFKLMDCPTEIIYLRTHT